MTKFSRRLLCGVAAALTLSACSSVFQPISSGKATTDYRSGISDLLRSLPPPVEPIVVAVYKFRDQTGQYKSSEAQVQYSTAVTQGATSMLIRALMEAGNGRWFTVLEREGLTDLMNERKIIAQTREMYANDHSKSEAHGPNLPPLLYAPVLLEGGIIAYETNLLTGGLGARYFGLGGSTEFRRDTVTSMLRAVSVKNGSVINHVDARKTIFSMQLDSGLYRFVSFMRLLEAEAGITSNEPPQMAVMEAIEACVYGMIMEGLVNKTWSFKDQTLIKSKIEDYLKQRDSKMIADFDDKGRVLNLKPVEGL
ncbi:MAG: CsgG/HfaB family protein [Methylococcaceae bacterium]